MRALSGWNSSARTNCVADVGIGSTKILKPNFRLISATNVNVDNALKEGRLRALATLLPNRSPLLPEVPTMAEAGLQELSIVPWAGLFGPAMMPKDVVDRLARAMAAVLARPDVREQLDRYAFEARSSTPEELSAFLTEQLDVWSRTVRDVGIARE